MARIRTIKPDFWTDSFMVQLPPLARLIYVSLWTLADDRGFIPDEPERLAMEVMPKEDPLEFDDWFQFFEATGRLSKMFAPDGSSYFKVTKWEVHQRVDKPSISRIYQEGSRKLSIPLEVRREVARKYKCSPGEKKDVGCYYCGAPGLIHWHSLYSGRPSAWITFSGLELDHLKAEFHGEENTSGNIVLACRNCNRSKGHTDWIEFLIKKLGGKVAVYSWSPREPSGTERKGKEDGKEGKGGKPKPARADAPDFDPVAMELPECVSRELWGKWIAYRRKRKLTCVEMTLAGQLKKLSDLHSKGHLAESIIAASIDNGWQGLFEPKLPVANGANGSRQASLEARNERVVEEYFSGISPDFGSRVET